MFNNYFMERAIQVAKESQGEEVPVGALIVDIKGNIIAEANNRCIRDNDPTAHAEILAIRKACLATNNYILTNCKMYVTLEPCDMCLKAIERSRIEKLVFGAYKNEKNPSSNLEVIGGVYENENEKLIKEFFKNKR